MRKKSTVFRAFYPFSLYFRMGAQKRKSSLEDFPFYYFAPCFGGRVLSFMNFS